MKKMGGMEGVMSLLPGASKIKTQMNNASIDEKMLVENQRFVFVIKMSFLTPMRKNLREFQLVSYNTNMIILKGYCL